MYKKRLPLLGILALGLTLAACTAVRPDAPALFDLGPQAGAAREAALAGRTISVGYVRAPAWLDTQLMYFRLEYVQQQQSRPYASSRWAMSPPELLTERVRQRIAQAGAVVLSASEGAADTPVLRIHLEEFSQHFATQGVSTGRITLRATLFRGRDVLGQRSFQRQAPAPTADAAGGAQALALATDAALTDLVGWLAAQPMDTPAH